MSVAAPQVGPERMQDGLSEGKPITLDRPRDGFSQVLKPVLHVIRCSRRCPLYLPNVFAMISSQRLPSPASATLVSPPMAALSRFEGWPAIPQRQGRPG